MTEKEKDIVTDILGRCQAIVLAELGPIDPLKAEDIARLIGAQDRPVRQDYARTKPYIAERRGTPDAEAAKQIALAEVRRTGNVAAATRHGVSRATLYRMLKR